MIKANFRLLCSLVQSQRKAQCSCPPAGHKKHQWSLCIKPLSRHERAQLRVPYSGAVRGVVYWQWQRAAPLQAEQRMPT